MNNIFKSALLLAGAAFLLTACSTDNDSNPTLKQPESFVLNTPAYANQAIDLAASSSVNLTWSQPDYGFPAATTYYVELSADNDWSKSLAEEQADESGETKCTYVALENAYTVCNAELDAATVAKALQQIKKYSESDVPESQTLYARVSAETTGASKIYSNVVKLTVTPYYVELKDAGIVLWYLVGNNIGAASWSNGTDMNGLIPCYPMPGAEYDSATGLGVVNYAGYFTAGTQFKFVRDPGSWDAQLNYTNGVNLDEIYTDEDGDNHNIGISEDGYYYIEVDTKANTFTIMKWGNATNVYTTMCMPGAYNGWDPTANAMNPKTTLADQENHDWCIMGMEFTEDTELKFAPGAWSGDTGGTTFPYGGGIGESDNIKVKAGKYNVFYNDLLKVYNFVSVD